MKKSYTFTAIFSRDGDDPRIYTVVFPALTGCMADGKGRRKARSMAEDALRMYLEELIRSHENIPGDLPSDEVEASLMTEGDVGVFPEKITVEIETDP